MNNWKYQRKNKSSIDRYFKDLRNFIDEIYNSVSSIEEAISRLDNLSINPIFEELANKAAKNIITFQAKSNARSWRMAAAKSSRGRKIYDYLKSEFQRKDDFNKMIEDSANLIKTLPRNIATRVVNRVAKLTIEGKRSKDIARDIKNYFPEASKASSILIARTQVAKTYSAITESRAKSVGINCYVWHTVGGPLVRDSHKHMNDVIIFYNDPPSPEELIGKKSQGRYHAGGIYNCRCYAEPILDLGDISWPHKVYYAKKIQLMSRKRFTSLLE